MLKSVSFQNQFKMLKGLTHHNMSSNCMNGILSYKKNELKSLSLFIRVRGMLKSVTFQNQLKMLKGLTHHNKSSNCMNGILSYKKN